MRSTIPAEGATIEVLPVRFLSGASRTVLMNAAAANCYQWLVLRSSAGQLVASSLDINRPLGYS